MVCYLDVVMLLNFLVDFLLLMGTNRLAGYPPGYIRSAAAATFGGGYAGVCMISQMRFLGNALWRLVSLVLMAVIAFGCNRSTLRRCVLFVFLSMALGGIVSGLESKSFPVLIFAAGCVALMCWTGFLGKSGKGAYVPVELTYGGKTYKLTALCDTGNMLSDPVTGQQVLVAGADIGFDIFGFTPNQLADPIITMERSPICGLRLIPYRAVGQTAGMLLAVRLDKVMINGQRAGDLVAFAPNNFGKTEAYQALTGGFV